MTSSIIICCNKQDEVLLPALERNLTFIYPDTSIYVAPCSTNPPNTTLPTVSSLRWKTNFITQDILKAMYSTSSDCVAKIDADTWHLKPYLFNKKSSLLGIQWAHDPHYILGIGYSMTKKAILELLVQEPCQFCKQTEEDQHLMWLARKRFPNDVYMLPVGTARKASTYNGQLDTCVVHLGCDSDPKSRFYYQQRLSSS